MEKTHTKRKQPKKIDRTGPDRTGPDGTGRDPDRTGKLGPALGLGGRPVVPRIFFCCFVFVVVFLFVLRVRMPLEGMSL